eukprot:9344114-Pyramimonas_sp.AAC.1
MDRIPRQWSTSKAPSTRASRSSASAPSESAAIHDASRTTASQNTSLSGLFAGVGAPMTPLKKNLGSASENNDDALGVL